MGFKTKGTALVRVDIIEGESRELASLMQNGGKPGDQPKAPEASPSIVVEAETIELPGVDQQKNDPAPVRKIQVASTANTVPTEVQVEALSTPVTEETVTVVPVSGAPKIYIQAGAFSQYANAVKTKARLESVGPTVIQQVNKADRPLFRVRVGPFAKVADADRLQDAIYNAGYPDARIVVEE